MLCEENYAKLLRLIPKINQGEFHSPFIHTQVLSSGPFTYTVNFNQAHTEQNASATCFKCRIYLDTKSVEVIHLRENGTPSKHRSSSPKDILNNKWTLNYFFEKWLVFLLTSRRLTHTTQPSMKA